MNFLGYIYIRFKNLNMKKRKYHKNRIKNIFILKTKFQLNNKK